MKILHYSYWNSSLIEININQGKRLLKLTSTIKTKMKMTDGLTSVLIYLSQRELRRTLSAIK